jgi:hypothetical protein
MGRGGELVRRRRRTATRVAQLLRRAIAGTRGREGEGKRNRGTPYHLTTSRSSGIALRWRRGDGVVGLRRGRARVSTAVELRRKGEGVRGAGARDGKAGAWHSFYRPGEGAEWPAGEETAALVGRP